MPVKPFTGKLDAPKVRPFTGELDPPTSRLFDATGQPRASIGPVPEGATFRLPATFRPGVRFLKGSQWVGNEVPINEQTIGLMAQAQVAEQAEAINEEIPMIERESFRDAATPILAATGASMLVPGSGWGALALQSLAAGGGGAAGELIRQRNAREPMRPSDALTTGAELGVGNIVGGSVIKGLGAIAKRMFSSPLSDPQKAAAAFARSENQRMARGDVPEGQFPGRAPNKAPFPLAFANPSSGAGRVQSAVRELTLPGKMRTIKDAKAVSVFLNNHVSSITDKGKPFDEVVVKGQQYLRKVFEPGEVIYTETFQKFVGTVGADTTIPLNRTVTAISDAAESLGRRGETKALTQRLNKILKNKAPTFTAKELDELHGGIRNDIKRNPNGRPEANKVMRAIEQDLDEYGQNFDLTFSDDIAKANAAKDELRELRNVPGLEQLATDFGERGGVSSSRQWMSKLFTNPNGKALAELRARNPELYHELADSWLGAKLSQFRTQAPGSLVSVVDGRKLRVWFEQNKQQLAVIYGKPQAEALDNFSLYASAMQNTQTLANKEFTPADMLWRGGSALPEAGALTTAAAMPLLGIPLVALSESGAYVLAKGLSDPSSTLFKVFTVGFSPTTRRMMLGAGGLGGQTTGQRPDVQDALGRP